MGGTGGGESAVFGGSPFQYNLRPWGVQTRSTNPLAVMNRRGQACLGLCPTTSLLVITHPHHRRFFVSIECEASIALLAPTCTVY